MKKLLSLLLLLSLSIAQASAFEVDGINYIITSSEEGNYTCQITGCTNNWEQKYIIPATVTNPDDGMAYNVTEVGDRAFGECQIATSIKLPEGITSIFSDAFAYCYSLSEIVIPSSVTHLADNVLDVISKKILLPTTPPIGIDNQRYGTLIVPLNSLATYAEACPSRDVSTIKPEACTVTAQNGISALQTEIGSVNIGSITSLFLIGTLNSFDFEFIRTNLINLVEINLSEVAFVDDQLPDNAFNGCSSLTSITLPERLTSIGSNAFEGCTALTSITLPESITSIGSNAFAGCTGLKRITIPASVTSLGDNAVTDACDILYLQPSTPPEGLANQNAKVFVVNMHGEEAYRAVCPDRDEISLISALILSPRPPMAAGWSGIEMYLGDNSVTKLKIVGPLYCEDFEYIKNYLKDLQELDLSDASIDGNYLPGRAFYGCSSLTSITIPEGITSIGSNAFESCSSLTSVTLPESLTSIGEYAFSGCSALTSIDLSGVTSIGEYAFNGCSALTSIDLSGVTSIGDYAFCNCSSLTSITIPEGITSISNSTFNSCSSLTSVTLPESLTSIGSNAFESCI